MRTASLDFLSEFNKFVFVILCHYPKATSIKEEIELLVISVLGNYYLFR